MHRRIPTHRLALTALFSLLLLWMQQETVRHALEHIGARIERSKYGALERPTADVCAECELLAAGASAMPASSGVTLADVPAWIDVVAPAGRTAIAAPSFYRSRAPPRFLQPA